MTPSKDYLKNRTLQLVWEGTPPRRRVGLALGGGAARGIAHVGVIEVLEENSIPIDCIAGTSAGSIVGGMYAAGLTTADMREIVHGLSWMEVASLSLPKLGLLNFDRVIPWIEECLGNRSVTFDELQMPFAAVAADITSGELVAINEGRLAEALRASSSVPGIFTPMRFRGRLLVDGGVLNNLPVSVARRLGADYVIAVDLLPPGVIGGKKPANVMDLTVMALYMLMRATHNEGPTADQVIMPEIGHIALNDLSRADELLAAGRAAAEEVVGNLRKELNLSERN